MKYPGFLLALLILLSGIYAAAQTNTLPSSAQLTELRMLVKDDIQLEATRQQKLLAQIGQATENLRIAAQFEQKTASMVQTLAMADATMESIRAELKTSQKNLVLSEAEVVDLSALEQRLLQTQSKIATAQQEVKDREAQSTELTQRQTHLPETLATLTAKLTQLEKTGALPVDTKKLLPWEITAKRWAIATEQHAVEEEIKLYKLELENFDTLKDLQVLQIDLATRQLSIAKAQEIVLRKTVDEQRLLESEAAAAQADQARLEATKHHPKVLVIAERNAELAALRVGEDGLSTRQQTAAADLLDTQKLTSLTQQRSEEIQQRIEAAGLTHAVAQLLSRERENLPDLSRYKPRIQRRKREIANTQIMLLDFHDQREELRDITSSVKARVAALGDIADDSQITLLLTEYLTAQRKQLDTLIPEYNSYFNLLVDLDTAEHKLIESVHLLSDEISEHILWVRSDDPISLKTPARVVYGFKFLAQGAQWKVLVTSLRTDLARNPYTRFLLILVELLLIGLSITARRRLKKIAGLVVRIRTDRFVYTLETLCYTLLRALPIPFPLFYITWRINAFEMHPFSAAIGEACFLTGILTLCCTLVYQAISPYGLSEVHFEANKTLLKWARRRLTILMATALPLLWMTTLLHQAPEEYGLKPLERVCYIGLQLSIAWFAFRLFSKSSEIMVFLQKNTPNKMLVRLRVVALFGVVGTPIVIIVFSLIGYYYSAVQMSGWFAKTLGLIFIIALVESLFIRGIQVVSRKSEFERRVRERQLLRDSETAGETEHPDLYEEDETNFITLNENTRKLINIFVGFALLFGLWFIWAGAVPALSLFDRIELWHVQNEGATAEAMTTIAISLADLSNAIIIFILTAAMARHLPSLVELAILRNLRMAYGERYAISTIIRYVTIAVGLSIGLGMLGLGWSKFKWLAAALSVGLGFGLQEIFANFISGLILLFERPIRVRDYVTVNGTSGEITRIQIRATTITDWDNKELLIPNKQFVTGELVNWTLTSAVLRVVIKVGVAYGSDTKKAEETLLRVAKNYHLTIADPAPTAFFTEFGDSSLNFELRTFIAHAEDFRLAKHELNLAVDAAFREAGIVIAFPQLDLHVQPEAGSMKPEKA